MYMILKKIAIVCLTIVGIMGSGYFIAGCNPDRQQMRQMIQSIVTGLKGKNDDSVYISHLSMFDRTRDSAKHTSEEVELLNNAILS
ncbi:MAG: hypothetical protein KAH77_04325, partial [Thiomargarita sp.]|nr:hypothetical protein [Thiomargarita sp.]